MWRRQVEAAAIDNSVVALDLPGHGRSSGIEGLPTIDAYADFVVRFAAALRLRPVVLVGRSMGAAIGMTIAVRRPELLQGLVLACAAARVPIRDENLAVRRDGVRRPPLQPFTPEA